MLRRPPRSTRTDTLFPYTTLFRSDLRILCYHGAALRDEHHFRPGLFMGKETFAARMALLARQGYPVIALDIAVAALPPGQSSEARRVGKECVRPYRSRWSPKH